MRKSYVRSHQGILLKINALKGELGQMICVSDFLSEGYSIIPTGKGSDFFVVKITSKELEKFVGTLVESKTGCARLSKLQKSFMIKYKQKKLDYRIYRVSNDYLKNFILNLLSIVPFLDTIESSGGTLS